MHSEKNVWFINGIVRSKSTKECLFEWTMLNNKIHFPLSDEMYQKEAK